MSDIRTSIKERILPEIASFLAKNKSFIEQIQNAESKEDLKNTEKHYFSQAINLLNNKKSILEDHYKTRILGLDKIKYTPIFDKLLLRPENSMEVDGIRLTGVDKDNKTCFYYDYYFDESDTLFFESSISGKHQDQFEIAEDLIKTIVKLKISDIAQFLKDSDLPNPHYFSSPQPGLEEIKNMLIYEAVSKDIDLPVKDEMRQEIQDIIDQLVFVPVTKGDHPLDRHNKTKGFNIDIYDEEHDVLVPIAQIEFDKNDYIFLENILADKELDMVDREIRRLERFKQSLEER